MSVPVFVGGNISIDAADSELYEKIRVGSDYNRVCANVANIADARIGNLPKTMINFVLMDLNFHQVKDMVRLASQLELQTRKA